jgi:hypothetical protein
MVYNYNQFLNEHINNVPLTKSYIRKLLININNKISRELTLKDFNIEYHRRNIEFYIQNIDNEKDVKIIKRILNSYQKNLINKGTVLSYKVSKSFGTLLTNDLGLKVVKDEVSYKFKIYIKDLNTIRIKPPKYVYHITYKKNVDNILKEGLKVKSLDEGHWKGDMDLYYPPAIFATIEKDDWYRKIGDPAIIQINTENLKNKWQKDINLHNVNDRISAIMTFENIPPEHLSYIDWNF